MAFAAIATIRQLGSAVISIVAFKHQVHLVQILGLLLVFASLGATVRYKLHAKARRVRRKSGEVDKDEKKEGGGDDEMEEGAMPPLPCTCAAGGRAEGLWRKRAALLTLTLFVFVAVLKSLLTLHNLYAVSAIDASLKTLHPTGVAFSALSCAVTMLWSMLLFTIKPTCFQELDVSMWPAFLCIAATSALSLGCTNAAALVLTPAAQQCIVALTPVITLFIESLGSNQLKQPLVMLATVGVTVGALGVSLAQSSLLPRSMHSIAGRFLSSGSGNSVNSLHTGGSNMTTAGGLVSGEGDAIMEDPAATEWLFGVLLQGAAVCGTATKYVLLRALCTRNNSTSITSTTTSTRPFPSMGPIALLFWVDCVGFVLLVPYALASGEMNTLVDSLWIGGPGISTLLFFTTGLGGILFLTELLALWHVDAVDLSASHTLASLLQASVVFLGAIYAAREFGGATRILPSAALFLCAITIAFLALLAYWRLVRSYAPNARIGKLVSGGLAGGCLGRVLQLGGAHTEGVP